MNRTRMTLSVTLDFEGDEHNPHDIEHLVMSSLQLGLSTFPDLKSLTYAADVRTEEAGATDWDQVLGPPLGDLDDPHSDWAGKLDGCDSLEDLRAVRAEAYAAGQWTPQLADLACVYAKGLS